MCRKRFGPAPLAGVALCLALPAVYLTCRKPASPAANMSSGPAP